MGTFFLTPQKFRLEVGTQAMDILVKVLETDRLVWPSLILILDGQGFKTLNYPWVPVSCKFTTNPDATLEQ